MGGGRSGGWAVYVTADQISRYMRYERLVKEKVVEGEVGGG